MAKLVKIDVTGKDIVAAKRWCWEHFGPPKLNRTAPLQWYHTSRYKIIWKHSSLKFDQSNVLKGYSEPHCIQQEFIYIRDQQLAMLFALKWL